MSSADDTRTRTLWERWCDRAAAGREAAFIAQLAFEGISVEQARAALRPVSGEAAPLPAWAEALRETGRLSAPFGAAASLEAGQPVPFEDLLLGLVDFAAARLPTPNRLSPEALQALQRGLLRDLSEISAPTLQSEFTLFCQRIHSNPLAYVRLMGDDTALYQAFVTQTGLDAIFDVYPVLGRLTGTRVVQWIETTSAFLQRLDLDAEALSATFWAGAPIGGVHAVRVGLSDRHHGGQSVIDVVFDCGLHVVYKPRSLRIDVRWSALVDWINRNQPPVELRAAPALDRGTHGWMAHVAAAPCDDARLFYRRAGGLLGLLYVLQCTDGHMENIIASGNHPVLIDLETLLAHTEYRSIDGEIRSVAQERLDQSVMRVSMLPAWRPSADLSGAVDLSGLGARGGQTVRNVLTLTAVNTSRMDYGPADITMAAAANVPTTSDGSPIDLREHLADVVAGFADFHRFMITHRTPLRAQLEAFRDCRSRLVLRNTRIYGALLDSLRHPIHLADGAVWSIGLRGLWRAAIPSPALPPCAPLVADEIAALERLDIPHFEVCCGDDGVVLENGSVARGLLEGASVDHALACLDRLDDADREFQCRLLEMATALHFETRSAASPSAAPPAVRIPPSPLLEEACAIAAAIEADALHDTDGPSWIAPTFLLGVDRSVVSPLDHGLYNGTGGIAIFFAALGSVLGGERAGHYRSLARRVLQPLRTVLHKEAQRASLVRSVGLGGLAGLGSMVYALACTATLLDDDAMRDDAFRFALLPTNDEIAADPLLDPSLGIAGALLGMLALHRRHPHPVLIERASLCGDRLLQTREQGAWPVPFAPRPLTGMAHGAAGFAWALLSLYASSGQEVWRDAAMEALQYEQRCFDADKGNWPDFRLDPSSSVEGPRFALAWCAGAGGVVLERAVGLPFADSPLIRADLDAGLNTILGAGLSSLDHYCCGNAGLIDIVAECGRRLARPPLTVEARARMDGVLARARAAGGFRFYDQLPPRYGNPTLFRGAAGVGYLALRLAFPERFPCVLSWE